MLQVKIMALYNFKSCCGSGVSAFMAEGGGPQTLNSKPKIGKTTDPIFYYYRIEPLKEPL